MTKKEDLNIFKKNVKRGFPFARGRCTNKKENRPEDLFS